jgi:hypothetical protein
MKSRRFVTYADGAFALNVIGFGSTAASVAAS